MRTSSPSLAKYLSAAMKRGPAPGVCLTPTRIRSESAAQALVEPTAMQNATTAAVSQASRPFTACCHDRFSIRAKETGRRPTAAALH